jgi:hypothetical protein
LQRQARLCVCDSVCWLIPAVAAGVVFGVDTKRCHRRRYGSTGTRSVSVATQVARQLGAVTSTAAAFDDAVAAVAGAALCGAIGRTEMSNQDGRQGRIVSLCGRLLCSMSLSVGVNAGSRANLTLVATGRCRREAGPVSLWVCFALRVNKREEERAQVWPFLPSE